MTSTKRWDRPPRPLPKRPYRDTVLVYGGMAAVIVIVGVVTGGGFVRSLVIAALFFVASTAWTLRRFRQRLRAEGGQRR